MQQSVMNIDMAGQTGFQPGVDLTLYNFDLINTSFFFFLSPFGMLFFKAWILAACTCTINLASSLIIPQAL